MDSAEYAVFTIDTMKLFRLILATANALTGSVLFLAGALTMWVMSQRSASFDLELLGRHTMTFLLPASCGLFVVGAAIALFRSSRTEATRRLELAIGVGLAWLVWVHTRDAARQDDVDSLFLIYVPTVLLSLGLAQVGALRAGKLIPD